MSSSATRWQDLSPLGFGPALAFILLFALVPLVALLVQAFQVLGGWGGLLSVLGPADGVPVLTNSLVQGSLSAVLAVAWGYPIGVLLGRYKFPRRETVLALFLIPFLLPGLVVVLAVEELFGRGGFLPGLSVLSQGLPAIIFVNVVYDVSMVALFTVAGVETASPRLEEAVATLGGGPWATFREVWGRPSLRGAAAGGLLTFLLAFLGFAPPLILGGASNYTVEDQIYNLVVRLNGEALAAGLAAWTIVLLALPCLLYLRFLRPSRGREGEPRHEPAGRVLDWRRPALWPLIGATLAFLGLTALVLGAVVMGSFVVSPGHVGLQNWSTLVSPRVAGATQSSLGNALLNTLFFAAGSTGLVLLVVLAASYARRTHPRWARMIDLPSFVPLLLSPVILAFALSLFWANSLDTPPFLWILILSAQSALALPFVLQSVGVAVAQVSGSVSAAARTLGARPFRAFLDGEVPAIRAALVAGALFAFALSLGEFAATNFLYVPTYTTLVVEMYLLQSARLDGALAALGGLLVLLSLASFLALLKGGARVRL